MFETIVSFVFMLLGLYLLAGLVFGVYFVFKGVEKIDEGAQGTRWGFRLLILPGTIALWPILLRKWRNVS
ncbi:MAG: hypothetical protein SF052_10635 [Bacteroidia bacterium]|nr:hypothetical protein [Bacteroidia bacterium]